MDAPERITMLDGSTEATFPYGAGPIEYIRADIADAERDAAFAMGVEAAAKAGGDAAVARAERLDPDLMPLRRQMIRQGVANPIRALAPMTPLQAALALPEVRELVEAGRLAEQQLIALGSDGFGSGLTAALAKLEAAK